MRGTGEKHRKCKTNVVSVTKLIKYATRDPDKHVSEYKGTMCIGKGNNSAIFVFNQDYLGFINLY